MKQVSTLFDALQNEKFAIAVRDEYGVKYYGYAGQGKEWADWANSVESKSLEESSIPAGIIQGPFKSFADDEIKSLISSFGYAEKSIDRYINSKSYRHASSVRIKSDSRVPAIMDTPVNFFDKDKYLQAVSYKCLSMRQNIKVGSFIHEANVNKYAFNFDTWMYVDKPNTVGYKSLRQRADLHVGRSSERRLGMKIKSALTRIDGRSNVGAATSLDFKSLDSDISIKSIGERIGGGTRGARRAARFATATFDPKAWDGDGDGIVQEGTAFERPAVPGINDRATHGVVNAAAATRAWENLAKKPSGFRDDGKIGMSADAVDRALGKRTMPRKPGAWDRERGPSIARSTRIPNGGPIQPPLNAPRTRRNSPTRIPNGEPIQAPLDAPRSRRNAIPKTRTDSSRELRGISSRISDARTERQITGFASRSGKSKARLIPGRDKSSETDGQIWESLSDAQKATVKSNLEKRYKEVQDWFKKNYGSDEIDVYGNQTSWWDKFLKQTGRKGVQKTDADGKKLNADSRIAGEALTALKLDVENTLEEIQNEIEVAKSNLAQIKPDTPQHRTATRKLKDLEKEHRDFKQNLEDLITFNEMHQSDDWSMIEHLHPGSRAASVGKTTTNRKNENYEDPFDGQRPAQKIDIKSPSSFFTEQEEYRKGKRSVVSAEKDEKIKKFARRVIEKAEDRRRKREMRKARKGTAVGLGAERDSTSSNVRRRIARAGRRIKRRLTGGNGPEQINKEIGKNKSANPTVFNNGINPDKPSITRESVAKLAALFRGRADEKDAEMAAEHLGPNASSNLGRMWNVSGFNAVPVQISEDDAEFLIGQGWKPIQRGHGSPNPPSRAGAEGFIDDYLNNPKRFITGEGGAMYGPGEYWSSPGRGNQWDSWVAGHSQGVGTLGLVSPDARLHTATESSKLQQEHRQFWNQVNSALHGIGGGTQGAKDLDPQDLLKEIKNALKEKIADGDPVWQSEVGKIAQQVFNFMASAGPEDKTDVWDAIQQMINLGGQHHHYTSMLYGYDGVDHEHGSPVVWFNRGAVAVVDKPMELGRMVELGETWKKQKVA